MDESVEMEDDRSNADQPQDDGVTFDEHLESIETVEIEIELDPVEDVQSIGDRIKLECVIALFTARESLPGLFQHKLLMLVFMFLPCVDMITDIINSGIVTDQKILVFFFPRI